jgi:hypothetical protein
MNTNIQQNVGEKYTTPQFDPNQYYATNNANKKLLSTIKLAMLIIGSNINIAKQSLLSPDANIKDQLDKIDNSQITYVNLTYIYQPSFIHEFKLLLQMLLPNLKLRQIYIDTFENVTNFFIHANPTYVNPNNLAPLEREILQNILNDILISYSGYDMPNEPRSDNVGGVQYLPIYKAAQLLCFIYLSTSLMIPRTALNKKLNILNVRPSINSTVSDAKLHNRIITKARYNLKVRATGRTYSGQDMVHNYARLALAAPASLGLEAAGRIGQGFKYAKSKISSKNSHKNEASQGTATHNFSHIVPGVQVTEGGKKRRKSPRKISIRRRQTSKKKSPKSKSNVYCASKGYYYKRMKSGKSKRIPKEDYMKMKK